MKNKSYKIGIIIIWWIFVINVDGQVLKESVNSTSLPVQEEIVVTAGAILNVGITNATCSGSVQANRMADITSVGICWNTRPGPTVFNDMTSCLLDSANFSYTITNLDADSIYFFRAFAITKYDTVYSINKVFFTHSKNAVADIDGNYYNTVRIGTQVWLAEDLKTSRFNDGTPVNLSLENSSWVGIKEPMSCWYGGDSVIYSFPRGRLYNWYAVGTGRLCPKQWHVPSNEEWKTLQNFLGGDSIAGGKLKARGTLYWQSPNMMATNQSGFTSFPSGYRNGSGDWFYANFFNYWWSIDEESPLISRTWFVYHSTGYLNNQVISKNF